MDRPRRLMRDGGLLLALSTPITGFAAYAFVSVLVGEERLESAASGSPTAAGYCVMALPLLAGLLMAAWAQFGGPVVRAKVLAPLAAGAGLIVLATGLWAISNSSGDASIGGGLLVLTGGALAIVALAVRATATQMPPGPTP